MCNRGGCRCVIGDGILGGKIWFRILNGYCVNSNFNLIYKTWLHCFISEHSAALQLGVGKLQLR